MKAKKLFIGFLIGFGILVVYILITGIGNNQSTNETADVGTPRNTTQSFWDTIPFIGSSDETSSDTDDVVDENGNPIVTTATPVVYEAVDEVVVNKSHLEGQAIRGRDGLTTLSIVFMENENYSGFYNPPTDSILISITGSPFSVNRLEAEQAFLQTTGLTPEEACTIDVSVTTPHFANPDEAGIIYRLSFCN